jgi:UDP-galactopyranose mutase
LEKIETTIIGAGLTGLSTAYHLKDGYVIFERENSVGGLCRTFNYKGFELGYSGHLIHLHNDYTKKLIPSLLNYNVKKYHRNAYIFNKNYIVPFPFQANLSALPEEIISECISGLRSAYRKRHNKAVQSIEDWVAAQFGDGLAKHFFIPYHTKLYGTASKNITAEWCDKFIPKPNFSEIIEGANGEQKKDFGYNIDFIYPAKGGIQQLPDALAKGVKNIRLNSAVHKIHWKEKKIEAEDNTFIQYEQLVSTIPLPELLRSLVPLPAEIDRSRKLLRWRSVHCLNLGIKKEDPINRHWAYFPEPEYIFYRVGFTHNFAPRSAPPGYSSLYVEIAGDPDEKIKSEGLFDKAIKDLRRVDILGNSDEIAARLYLPIPYAYVVYDHNRSAALKTIQAFLSKNSIYSIGRYGGWKYSFMEESILDGKQLAESLLRKRK